VHISNIDPDAVRTIEIAVTLASIYLSGSTIKAILARNKNMTVLLEEFPWSQFCKEVGPPRCDEVRGDGMRVWIDSDLCSGTGQCSEIAPDIFERFVSSWDPLHERLKRTTKGFGGPSMSGTPYSAHSGAISS
jgi:hypothetical protein